MTQHLSWCPDCGVLEPCPLHAAAGEMRETVQWLVDVIEGFYGRDLEDAAGKGELIAVRKARALLAKVEGR